ncbi:MAG: hypothetical protein ACE5JP_08025, partial [Candidatus Bipolaricaulia bacterium]
RGDRSISHLLETLNRETTRGFSGNLFDTDHHSEIYWIIVMSGADHGATGVALRTVPTLA